MLPAVPFILGALLIEEFLVLAGPPLLAGTLIMLAFSRKREVEADEMGMLIMKEAGYDPTSTVGLWEKMTVLEQKALRDQGARQQAQYLSTHPHVSADTSLLRVYD